MPEKHLSQMPWETLAPGWVYLIATLAGFVAFLEEIKPEDGWRTKVFKAFARIMSSALAAVLTFQFLQAASIPEAWHIPITGIGAHMGTEALKKMGELYKSKLGIPVDDKSKVA